MKNTNRRRRVVNETSHNRRSAVQPKTAFDRYVDEQKKNPDFADEYERTEATVKMILCQHKNEIRVASSREGLHGGHAVVPVIVKWLSDEDGKLYKTIHRTEETAEFRACCDCGAVYINGKWERQRS